MREPIEDFRTVLAVDKAEHFPEWSIDEMTYTRDEAVGFCQLVKTRLGATRLTRPFTLKSLVGIRKDKVKRMMDQAARGPSTG